VLTAKPRALASGPFPLLSRHAIEQGRTERALKNLLSQTDRTTDLPQNRTAQCRELLRSAIAITDDLLKQAKLPAAAILGRKGGAAIAKRGSDYFRKLAA